MEPSTLSAANNRVMDAGFSYDAVGNMTADPSGATYTFDAENRMVTASGEKYTYDGDGRRVTRTTAAGVTSTFVYDAAGQLAAEYGGSNTTSGPLYLTGDHLGSTRLITDSTGAAVQCRDYLPFGEQILVGAASPRIGLPCFSAEVGVNQQFTGKERDAETGLDYFGARYMSGAMGRWTSPDWSAVPTPIPYADLRNPQTLNLYGYVANNPLGRPDLDGHYDGYNYDKPIPDAGNCSGSHGCVFKGLEQTIGPDPGHMRGGHPLTDLAIGFGKRLLRDGIRLLAPKYSIASDFADFELAPSGTIQRNVSNAYDILMVFSVIGDAFKGAAGLRTITQAGLSVADATRIQNAADRTGQTIILFGSRANGTAGALSDYDYILTGATHSARHSASSSLPRGLAGGAYDSGIDILQNANPAARNYMTLDPSRPFVVFTPRRP